MNFLEAIKSGMWFRRLDDILWIRGAEATTYFEDENGDCYEFDKEDFLAEDWETCKSVTLKFDIENSNLEWNAGFDEKFLTCQESDKTSLFNIDKATYSLWSGKAMNVSGALTLEKLHAAGEMLKAGCLKPRDVETVFLYSGWKKDYQQSSVRIDIDSKDSSAIVATKTAGQILNEYEAELTKAAEELQNKYLEVLRTGHLGIFSTPSIPPGILIESDEPPKALCVHSWKSYHGLSETYEFCEHCNEKK